MTGIFKFKMAPKRSPLVLWIIFAFSMILNVLPTDGAPLFTFNGTGNVLQYNEKNAHLVNTSVSLVYEGNNYNQFYISKDGYVMFTTDKSAVRYLSQDWTAADVSPFVDFPFIAPYYFKAHPLDVTKGYLGRVYYQELLPNTANSRDLLTLGQYISSLMIGRNQFNPTWAMGITWENVTAESQIQQGNCDGTKANPCNMNTFQLILLSDGSSSFAIFNYFSMNAPVGKFDQAGFNGGNGIGFDSVLGQSVRVDQLSNYQSSDMRGRYVFDITSGTILRGGCNTDRTDKRLSVSPNFAGMFGGKIIDISGPCFPTSPRCLFTDPSTQISFNGTVISVSQTRLRCAVPRMTIRGRIVLTVSIDNGLSYPYQAPFTIVFSGRIKSSEHVSAESSSSNMAWFSISPSIMTISWDPSLLANGSHMVDVSLIGYRETNGQAMFTQLTKLGSNINGNSGSYSVDPSQYQCTGQNCFDYEVGLLEVRLQDGATPQKYKFLSSKAIPLGWYVKTAMTSQYGSNWPTQKCVNWYNQDKQNTTWTNNLLSCPCTLNQAMADFGRFQPDNGCNLMNAASSANCFYHTGAVHCVRAVQPTADGSGNQCCYNSAHYLVYAADSFQGSTPDRSHDWGAAPYGKPGYVPSLSHWIKDVVTFYYCCLWTEYNSCDHYMDLRPTKDCVGYTAPVPASVFGQGFVMSFGGQSLRILSQGDYTLLKAGNTTIQGRFENNTITATDGSLVTFSYILSAVSIQDNGASDRVELHLRKSQFDRSVKFIDVRVNGQLITFNEDSMRWQDFKGVAVVNTDYNRKLQSNFTVIMTNGIGFQVAEKAGTLQLDLMVPSSFSTSTGIFGSLAGNMSLPNGTYVNVSTMSNNDLFHTYELQWAVPDQGSSLFNIYLPANFSFGPKITFERPALPNLNQRSIANLCGSNKPCSFDYRTTGSMELARSTVQAQKRYMALSNSVQPVRTCGLLNVPRATKSDYNIVLGTQTTITGCRTGALSGPSTYTCTETSNQTQAWSPSVTSTCEVTTEEATTTLIVAILVPVVVVVFIAIIVAVCIYKKRKRSRNAGPPRVPEYDAGYHTTDEIEKERYPARRPSNEYTI